MENSKQNMLAVEPVGKLLLRLSAPAVVSQLVNLLYNIVDRVYIGHIPENGVNALTGLGLCFPIIICISAFAALFGMGGAPRAAIAMGSQDDKLAERILGSCVSALLLASAVLTVLFLIFGRRLLLLFGASAETIPYAWSYLRIYVCGTVFVLVSHGLNMFISTQGFAVKAMVTVLIGALLNTILDPIFIFVFNLGVAGAAAATVISQAVSAIWVLVFLCGRTTKLRVRRETLRIDIRLLLSVMALGLSPFIMQSTESLLSICFNSSLQRYGGDLAVGTMTILSSVSQFMFLPLQGIAQGAQPIISFNYGAKNYARVRRAFKLLLTVSLCYTFLLSAAVELNPVMFIKIFNNRPELISIAEWSLRVYCAGLFVMGAQMACQQSFVSLGQAKISLLLACLRKLILLIPLIYILPPFFENKVFAVFLAEPVSDIIAATVTTICFTVFSRRLLQDEKS